MSQDKKVKTYQVVVFDGDKTHNWVDVFEDKTLKDGSKLRIIQTSWYDSDIVVYPDGAMLQMSPVVESEGKFVKPKSLIVKPDFVIIRNQARGPTPDLDRKNVLLGLMMSGVPSMNSCMSEYMNLERPVMYGALKEIQKRLGDKFPLIAVTYYSTHNGMVICEKFPSVIKVSHVHAGMGKIKVENYEAFRDVSTILALNSDYCTAEPYIEIEYGMRIEKIGNDYRAHKKIFHGSGWKSHFGNSHYEDMEMTSEFKLWADECTKIFGGLDWFAIDVAHGKDGKDYILELNGSAIGLAYWKEDTIKIRDLCLKRMDSLFCKK
eukprot:gene7795-12269_t